MRGRKPMKKLRMTIPGTAAACMALAVAATGAFAAVTVYDNSFANRTAYSDVVKSGGGKACERRYRAKSKSMLATVRRGPSNCSFRPPVVGDRELPNHEVRLDGKILKRTDKKVRGGAFLELTVRAGGGGTGYTLRVLPKKKRFVLSRGPGGSGFPVQGKSDAIKGINDRNQLRLSATGAEIRAFVNGEEVAKVSDSDPGQVPGRKLRFAVGNQKDKAGKVVATFKRIALAVPDP
jgi:hypothetical protein